MKTPLSHEQMMMIIDRARRERNAVVAEVVTALPRKALVWISTSAEKFRQARAMMHKTSRASGQTTQLRYFGASVSI